MCDMLANDSMDSMFCIPSQSSCLSLAVLDQTVAEIFRSESSPTNPDKYRNKILDESAPDMFTSRMSNKSAERFHYSLNDVFLRDEKCCTKGCTTKIGTKSSTSTLFVTKRSHNFQVGLEMHEESVRSKRGSSLQGQQDADDRMNATFRRLPSAELWEALLQ